MIKLKRIYAAPAPEDGQRILIDRLWARGLTKAAAHVDLWLKGLAPSTALRQWFHHDPGKWREFQDRYWAELRERPEALATLYQAIAAGPVTLLYAAKDEAHNNAVALKAFLEQSEASEGRPSLLTDQPSA